jgi:hypothetical protein
MNVGRSERHKFPIDFTALQADQWQHDAAFHHDIHSMADTEALQHFAMHFGKYSWVVRHAIATGDEALRYKTLVDTFIICLAGANRLAITNLTKHVLNRPYSTASYADAFQEQMAAMCKAGEAADHENEQFPVRQTMESAVIAITRLTWDEAEASGIDLDRAVRARWAQIESRQRSANTLAP